MRSIGSGSCIQNLLFSRSWMIDETGDRQMDEAAISVRTSILLQRCRRRYWRPGWGQIPSNRLAADVAAVQGIDAVCAMLDEVCRLTGMGFAAVARVTSERWVACQVLDKIEFGLNPGDELKLPDHDLRRNPPEWDGRIHRSRRRARRLANRITHRSFMASRAISRCRSCSMTVVSSARCARSIRCRGTGWRRRSRSFQDFANRIARSLDSAFA